MNFSDAVSKVLQVEGGFVNDLKDPGGATNFGITKKVYEVFKGRSVSVEDIKAMPRTDAVAIYKKNYWDAVGGDKIKSYNVAYTLFDQAVNRGVIAAIKQAQKILGLAQDGVMGSKTLQVLNSANESSFLSQYLSASITAYQDLVSRNPDLSKFLTGWMNRVSSISSYVKVSPATATTGIIILSGLFFLIYFGSSNKTRTS